MAKIWRDADGDQPRGGPDPAAIPAIRTQQKVKELTEERLPAHSRGERDAPVVEAVHKARFLSRTRPAKWTQANREDLHVQRVA